jgi:hypothetical protein
MRSVRSSAIVNVLSPGREQAFVERARAIVDLAGVGACTATMAVGTRETLDIE